MNYFTPQELQCKCGCGMQIDPKYAAWLECVRDDFGKPMIINSGARCPKRNAEVGGEPDSAHLLGLAADIAIDNAADRFKIVAIAIDLDAVGIGIYPTWIHLDIKERTIPVLWVKA